MYLYSFAYKTTVFWMSLKRTRELKCNWKQGLFLVICESCTLSIQAVYVCANWSVCKLFLGEMSVTSTVATAGADKQELCWMELAGIPTCISLFDTAVSLMLFSKSPDLITFLATSCDASVCMNSIGAYLLVPVISVVPREIALHACDLLKSVIVAAMLSSLTWE